MDLIIREKKIKDNVCCTEESFPIAPLFLQQSFIILLPLLSPFPCTPYEQGVREVMAAHYFMQEKCLLPPLYPPCSMVQGKLVQPRNNDFPCQSIQNLDTSSVGSCSKFHEILYQVLPLHPASFPFGGEG